MVELAAQAVGLQPPRVVVGGPTVALEDAGTTMRIPSATVEHARRFGNVPTNAARDIVAALTTQAQPALDEADRVAFVEAFLRQHVIG